MKSRHLCALVLFGALVLLQARIALADYLASATEKWEAACCAASGETTIDANRAPLSGLCVDHCIRPFAPRGANQKVFVPLAETSTWMASSFVAEGPPRQFLAEQRVEGRHLLYRLQRLLI